MFQSRARGKYQGARALHADSLGRWVTKDISNKKAFQKYATACFQTGATRCQHHRGSLFSEVPCLDSLGQQMSLVCGFLYSEVPCTGGLGVTVHWWVVKSLSKWRRPIADSTSLFYY